MRVVRLSGSTLSCLIVESKRLSSNTQLPYALVRRYLEETGATGSGWMLFTPKGRLEGWLKIEKKERAVSRTASEAGQRLKLTEACE